MVKRHILIILSICMLALSACGQSDEVNKSETTPTPQPIPEQQDPIPYTDWVTVQQELEQQNLKYQGTYTYLLDRLDVTVEDGTTMVFLNNSGKNKDETGMWYDYKERDPEKYILVMKNEEFYNDVFEKYWLRESERGSESYYQPDASQIWGEITPYSMGVTGVSISRNQIFAKYGRKFKDPFLNAIFSQKSWYEPKYSAEEFVEGKVYHLTDTEQENLDVLLNIEERQFLTRKPEGTNGVIPLASGSWIDLDVDGTKEQITYDRKYEDMDFSTVTITVQSAEGEATYAESLPCPRAICFLVNIEGVGNLLAIGSDGISADNRVDFLQYKDNQLISIGYIATAAEELIIDGETMIGNVESYHFQCQPLKREYVIKENQIVEIAKDYYEYRGNAVIVLVSIPIYSEKAASSPTGQLKVGEEVIILGGDLKEWVQLKRVATGETCWIPVKKHFCYAEDGTEEYSENIFNGLTFYD